MLRKLYAERLERLRDEARNRRQETDWTHYQDKPTTFVRSILGEQPWSIQADIIEAVAANRQVVVPSCFGSGKDWVAARIGLWWVATGGVLVATGNTFPQLKDQFWRELRRGHKKGKTLPGNPSNGTDLRWEVNDYAYAVARKPDDNDPEGLQGTHAERVMVIIDEANGVPTDLWDAVKGLIVNAESRLLAIGNPYEPQGPFYEACRTQTWKTIHISVFDTPNFHCACGARYQPPTADQQWENGVDWFAQHIAIHGTYEDIPAIARNSLVSPVWVQDRLDEGLEGTPWWDAKVLGRFPDTATNAVISPALVEAARARAHLPDAHECAGLDIARFGSDDTCLVEWSGNGPESMHIVHGHDTMEVAGLGARFLKDRRGTIAIDDGGVGGGVVDRLREQRLTGHILAVNAGESPDNDPEDRLLNMRAQLWWSARLAFQAGEVSLARLDEKDYRRLLAELTAPTYKFTSNGKVQIESKDDLKKRGVPSPDVADAFNLALYARSRARRRVTFGAAA
jgi:phage terminase large subunit